MAPRATDAADQYESFDYQWEEVGDDNGELISFVPGKVMYGTFVHRVTIDLPEDKQDNGQTTADMLVFDYPDDGSNTLGKRWSVWVTYQLDKAFEKITEGDFCRVECTGERKARQGNVLVFSVRRRVS